MRALGTVGCGEPTADAALFVVMELGKEKYKTDTVAGDTQPKWNQECILYVSQPAACTAGAQTVRPP